MQRGDAQGRGHRPHSRHHDQRRRGCERGAGRSQAGVAVRSSTPQVVVKNSQIVDRCFKSGALAVGAQVEITTIPGYLPMRNDSRLQEVFRRNASDVVGENATMVMPAGRNRGGSTDMGDLSQLIPAIHPYTGEPPARTQQELCHHRLRSGGSQPGEDNGNVGHRPAVRRGEAGQRSQVGAQGGDVPQRLPAIPARAGQDGAFRRRGVLAVAH